MTTSNISKFNRLVMGVAVAALIAASCGSDESAVVEPVEPAPVETTAPTTAPTPTADVGEPATVEDADPTVEAGRGSATTTTAAEVPSEAAVDEDPPAGTTGEEPADEQEQPVTAEPEPSVTTPTSVPVSVEDPGIADRALAFLAGELGVPESEITLTGTETAVWADTSLGCPKEGYAYATVMTPGYEFTFSHGTASHVVHTDELGTYFVRPVDCYEPAEPEPTTTTQPEPTPETTLPPEEPDDTSTTAIPEPEQPVDPWERVANEPVLASELWPEGAEDGTPYPDDLYCHVPSDGEFECYYTTPEPEPEPEQQPEEEDTPPASTVWVPPVAGMVPEVHPDVPLTEWQRGPVDPLDRAYDKPRTTGGVRQWRDWCYSRWDSCGWAEHNMYQALDYLGANEQCVLNEYTRKAEYFLREGSGANNSYAKNSFGWHLCATVIDPIIAEIPAGQRENDVGLRLSDTPGITLAERCRVVLTDQFHDIQLEARPTIGDISAGIPPTRFGQDCDRWAAYVIENGLATSAPECNASSSLAEEWMEHHHNQHELYFRPHC